MNPSTSAFEPGFDAPFIAASLESWFAATQRPLPWRKHYDPYQILVSELMLQQTRVEVVVPYFRRFVEAFPDAQSLAGASEEQVMSLWSGLGYYRRARALRSAAGEIVARHEGKVPPDLGALEALPGVGRYTAGAIRSIGHDLPAPVVEGNVTRVLSRFLGITEPAGTSASSRQLWSAAEELSKAATSPRMLSQSLMELGATVCTPQRPACEVCPLAAGCVAREQSRVEELPRKAPRSAQVRLNIPLYIVRRGGELLAVRLNTGSLMRRMVHLPHGSDDLLPMGLTGKFLGGRRVGTVRHSVTNRRIEFEVMEAEAVAEPIGDGPHEFFWLTAEEILARAHPSYVAKAMKLMEE